MPKQNLFSFDRVRKIYERFLRPLVRLHLAIIAIYVAASAAIVFLIGSQLGMEIFPVVDAGEFRLRLRAPDGTHIERTEQITLDVLKLVRDQIGADNIALTLGYVGSVPSTYPINAVYQFMRGPEEAFVRISLKHGSGNPHRADKRETSSRIGDSYAKRPVLSFELPADIVSETMSFGAPTPIEIAARGANLAHDREYIKKIQAKLSELTGLRRRPDLTIARLSQRSM